MVDLIGVVLVLVGLVLLFAGAALSIYGVAVLGAVVGGGGGFLFAPTVGGLIGFEGLPALVAATALGIVAGVVVTYMLLSVAIGAVSFVAGIYVALVVAPLFADGLGLLVYPVALVAGLAAAAVGSIMTRTMMVLVTSFAGATLVSRSLTLADLAAAQTRLAFDPLVFDPTAPLFLGLFVLGVLSQFGLFKFGYVTKLVSLLPGASVFEDRERRPRGQ